VFNLACIFSWKGFSNTGQPSAVDRSVSLSRGGCESPEEPLSATFHCEEQEGIKEDFCQGGNQDQTK